MAKFTWFEKFTRVLDKMPDPDRTAMMMAIVNYGTYGTEPDFGYPLSAVFEGVREDIDNSVCARTANKGGRPKKAVAGKRPAEDAETHLPEPENGGSESGKPGFYDGETQTIPSHTNPIQTNKEKKGGGAPAARFRPPTADEVAAYARERGLAVDAGRFCDFYASKGWRVGRDPMKDWKAAVRGWAARDRPKEAGGAKDEYSML